VRRSTILVVSLLLTACTPATVKVWPSSGTPVASDGGIVVQAGDSLYGIASRNGLSVVDLAQANGIAEPFIIHPGDRLRLPVAASPRLPVAPAPTVSSVRTEALPEAAAVSKPPVAPKSVAAKPVASSVVAKGKNASVAAVKATPSKVPTTSTASTVPTKPTDANRSAWRWPAEGALVNAPARSDATAYALDIAGNAGSPVRATAAGKVLYSGEGSPGYEQLVVIEHSGGWVSSYSHNRKRLVGEGQSVAAGAVIAEMGRTGASRDMVHFELRRAGQLVDPRTVLPPR